METKLIVRVAAALLLPALSAQLSTPPLSFLTNLTGQAILVLISPAFPKNYERKTSFFAGTIFGHRHGRHIDRLSHA
jgi:hypothetical protein